MNARLVCSKTFDIFSLYGRIIFGLSDKDTCDMNDITLYKSAALDYIGSFLLTYCPVSGESLTDNYSNRDRFEMFRESSMEFSAPIEWRYFSGCNLGSLVKYDDGLEFGDD